jgi:hypothetical protein
MQLILTGIKQLPPITSTTAQVQVSFEIHGILPDFVQIYAVNAAGTGLGVLVDKVDMSPPEINYDDPITLQAGTLYTIHACPRTGTEQNPDEMIDGAYWESYCVAGTITTLASSSPPGGNRPPPVIINLDPEPATINQDNRIAVAWSSTIHYDRFLVWWTENGVALAQGEIDTGGYSGSWTTRTRPGYAYTFAVDGGVSAGVSGFNYSGWGPTEKITASLNLTSLRQFLQHSGINPAGEQLRSRMPSGVTLRKFMKL